MKNKKQERITRIWSLGQKGVRETFLIQYLSKCEWSKSHGINIWERMIQKSREAGVKSLKQGADPLLKAQQESQKPEWSECRGEGQTVAQRVMWPRKNLVFPGVEMESHLMLGGRAVTASDLGPVLKGSLLEWWKIIEIALIITQHGEYTNVTPIVYLDVKLHVLYIYLF